MVKSLEYSTNGPSQTKKIGEILAQEIAKTKLKKVAFIIALEGELGSGKTTFLQGFARGLRIKEKILSPTFIIMRRFKIRRKSCQFANFYHIDCYRIGKPKEILDLGFKEIVSNPENIVAIEWADRIKNFLPKNALVLKFKFITRAVAKSKRRASFPLSLTERGKAERRSRRDLYLFASRGESSVAEEENLSSSPNKLKREIVVKSKND